MIEKKIYYVWVGGDKTPLANICIENWKDKLISYEIIEINEKTIEYFDFEKELENNLWFKTVYDLKMWAYVSDYMRVKVLYEFGGIYLDTDITIYKDFSSLLNQEMFIGVEKANITAVGVFGCKKHNKILKEVIDFYSNEIWQSNLYTIPSIFSNIIHKIYNIYGNENDIVSNDNITIYPKRYFYPYCYDEQFDHSKITDDTFTVHWWNASWATPECVYFLKNKHQKDLKNLLAIMDIMKNNKI